MDDRLLFECPVCGWECTEGSGVELWLDGTQLEGMYCTKCYMAWVAANIPKMVLKEKQAIEGSKGEK